MPISIIITIGRRVISGYPAIGLVTVQITVLTPETVIIGADSFSQLYHEVGLDQF